MYKRTDSKYRSRGHYRDELALHNAEIRKAKPRKRKVKVESPERTAMLELSSKMRRMRLFAQPIPEAMETEYRRLMGIYHEQLAAASVNWG